MFKNKTTLITGGVGFLGRVLTERLLKAQPKKIIIYSRDEYKQFIMKRDYQNNEKLRFFIGDVRDLERLKTACHEVDYICHCAALKRVPELEYNCTEAIETNINGSMNVIKAAIENNVKKVVAISTDKAVSPVNLYGASKLCMEKLMINGNALSGNKTQFAIARYGNVENSTGSVIPYFNDLYKQGIRKLPLTDERMTRFNITSGQAVNLIFTAFKESEGGEIFIPKIPSFKITDLVKSMNCAFKVVGIRPGEKLHEVMITREDASRTYDCGDYYIIQPDFDWIEGRKFKGKKVCEGFSYSSDKNTEWVFK